MGEVGCLKDERFQNLQVENAVIESSGHKLPVVRITTATYTPTVLQSGTIFSFNSLVGCDVSLPPSEPGLVYEFHVGITPTSADLIIDAASGDTYEGITDMASIEGLAINSASPENHGWAGIPTSTIRFITGNVETTGRGMGTHLVFKCMSPTIWVITGHMISAGVVDTPFDTV